MVNQSTVRMVFGALRDRERKEHFDALAKASIAALETVEREMTKANVTHPIPLRVSRAMLEEELHRTRSPLDLRLINLQLRLLEEGKAKAAGSKLDFEIFCEI